MHEFMFKNFYIFMQKDAIYLLGAYDIECFDFLVMTFAIELKKSCLDYVREQLEELAEKVYPCLFI